MRPGGNRDKGVGWELVVAKQIAKDLGGFNQQRYLPRAPDSGARIQWKGDIVAADKLAAIWPFLIECKKQEGWQLDGLIQPSSKHIVKEWFAKACEQAKESYDKVPLLIFARNYQPWLVAYLEASFSDKTYGLKSFIQFEVEVCERVVNGRVMPYKDFMEKVLCVAFVPRIKELGIIP